MGVLKTTFLISGIVVISVAGLVDYYYQTKNESSLASDEKLRLQALTCYPFDSWISLLALIPFILVIPLMVGLGSDYSQLTGLLFLIAFFVSNVVHKLGFMYRRNKALINTAFPDDFIGSEKSRMMCNAWLEPIGWAVFLIVLILPLGP